ncbi:MAG: HEPN domain-containing protein [Candidatus Hydrothermarchaeales archaeon]
MNLDGCFEKRLLKRRRPDRLKSQKALEIAGEDIKDAERLLEHSFYKEVVLKAYTAMFQCARAVLFRDGVFEKSHYCVIQYLSENYVKKGKLEQSYVHWLDTYRVARHEALYGLEKADYSDTDASDALMKAKKFLKAFAKIAV